MTDITDLYHYMGGDLDASPAGDLKPATLMERNKQRILRRLLTNPGDNLFHPDYGAGLGQKVGDHVNIGEWTALIKGQMLLEECVAASPAPSVTVSTITDGASVTVGYTDAQSGDAISLSFDVTK